VERGRFVFADVSSGRHQLNANARTGMSVTLPAVPWWTRTYQRASKGRHAAYIFANIRVNDSDAYEEYSGGPETIEQYAAAI